MGDNHSKPDDAHSHVSKRPRLEQSYYFPEFLEPELVVDAQSVELANKIGSDGGALRAIIPDDGSVKKVAIEIINHSPDHASFYDLGCHCWKQNCQTFTWNDGPMY